MFFYYTVHIAEEVLSRLLDFRLSRTFCLSSSDGRKFILDILSTVVYSAFKIVIQLATITSICTKT